MKVAIFCGSASGNDVVYEQATQALGKYLAKHGVSLVYGGGNVGLMGTIADSFLAEGAAVYGVMPEHLVNRELAHRKLTELTIVADMRERKAAMMELADAFVALPGGAGTMEEIFEAWTWGQLGLHKKPSAFYNVNGYYDDLLNMITTMADSGFVRPQYAQMLIKTDRPEQLLSSLQNYQAPADKWS
jgi:uncharacterized protein (TIGR00730 family)